MAQAAQAHSQRLVDSTHAASQYLGDYFKVHTGRRGVPVLYYVSLLGGAAIYAGSAFFTVAGGPPTIPT